MGSNWKFPFHFGTSYNLSNLEENYRKIKEEYIETNMYFGY